MIANLLQNKSRLVTAGLLGTYLLYEISLELWCIAYKILN
jgi:hypothetical protein